MIPERTAGGCCSLVKPVSSRRCSRIGLVKGDCLGSKLICVPHVMFWNLVREDEIAFIG